MGGADADSASPWEELRKFTQARIALGRSGGSLPTPELLRFQCDHAAAIDAVYSALDVDRLRQDLDAVPLESIPLCTQAQGREDFLLRPDHGRRLAKNCAKTLSEWAAPAQAPDVIVAIVDGLSALAPQRHAVPVLSLLAPRLAQARLTLGPVPIVVQGRVAVQDAIGEILGARLVVSLIGERPGLGAPDSLGAYLVYRPRPGNTDANRNCVSNIRPEGLGYAAAADTLTYLITEAIQRKVSGVTLKDTRALPERELDAGGQLDSPMRRITY